MKKLLINIISPRLVALAGCCVALAACSDWTDTESLEVKNPRYGDTNPQAYAQYLTELRGYKNADHKVLYSWFDNIAVPTSSAHHLSTLPDSVDVVSLMNVSTSMPRYIIDEMKQIREDMGTKTIYTVDYNTIDLLYTDYEAGLEEVPAEDGFPAFAADYMAQILPVCDQYGFDGIAFCYPGKSSDHMTEVLKAQYLARQDAFMSKAKEWVESHPSKLFVFEGTPHFLTDPAILSKAKYIVLRTFDAKAPATLSYAVRQAIAAQVPTDRFIVAVSAYPLDKLDKATGRFTDGNGNTVRAILAGASWVATPEAGFTKLGLGINNIQNDYYKDNRDAEDVKTTVYQTTRTAITTMNPTPKQ